MQWAIVDNIKRLPFPGAHGICPGCGGEVLAKCGQINLWHWAHKARDCDPWWEPEGEWHRQWKGMFPETWQEVTIRTIQDHHRADIQTPKFILELQHSLISSKIIQEREAFYGKMVWLVDASAFWERFYLRDKATHWTFTWDHARKSWLSASSVVILDFGRDWKDEVLLGWDCEYDAIRQKKRRVEYPGSLFVVKKFHDKARTGWGYFLTEHEFLERCGISAGEASF